MPERLPEVLSSALEKDRKEEHELYSLDALMMLLHSDRLRSLRDQSTKEFKELHQRQADVRELHDILKAINKATSEKGDFDAKSNDELIGHLKKAKKHGVDVVDDKTKYSRDDRDRLVENLRMTIEDLNVQNDMQLQTVQRLTNERYESYQMSRTIFKTLHDDKHYKARKIAG